MTWSPAGSKGKPMNRSRLFALIIALMISFLCLWFFPYPARVGLVYAGTQVEKQNSGSPDLNLSDDKEKSLISALMRRQRELDAREQELKVKEARLLSIEKDIETRIDELNGVRDRIEGFVKKIDAVNEDRVRKIVKIYDLMKPEEAALRLEKLNEDMAVMVLSSLNEKKTAKILAVMDVNKSVRLSQAIKVKK